MRAIVGATCRLSRVGTVLEVLAKPRDGSAGSAVQDGDKGEAESKRLVRVRCMAMPTRSRVELGCAALSEEH